MDSFILPMILTFGGTFFLIRNITHMRDEDRLRHYLENSRKGRRWVDRFGIEKSMHLTRKYFLPLGIVMAFVLLCTGLWGLFQLI